MKILPRTLFVGFKSLSNALEENRTDLNFVNSVETISEMWDGLDDGSIDADVDVIFTIDNFFDPSGENTDLENMVAMLSPHCLMIIIQYNPKFEDLMREKIRLAAQEAGTQGSEEFYFINPRHPNKGIDEAKSGYITRHPDNDISLRLQGIDREEYEAQKEAEKEALNKIKSVVPGLTPDNDDDGVGRDGKIIAVTSTTDTSGTTLVSTLMTTYISHGVKVPSEKDFYDSKVCIVDFNLSRGGQLGFVIGSLKPSILKMRSESVSLDVLEETVIYSENLKADCLLLPQKPKLTESLSLEFFGDVLALLRKNYDYIIVDVPCGFMGMELDLVERVVYPMSDLIVYITNSSSISLLSMARWVETVKSPLEKDGMDISVDKLGVVVNDFIPDVGISGSKIAKLSRGLPVISVIPSNKKLVTKATNHQSVPVILRDDSFREAVGTLVEAVLKDGHQVKKNIFS